MNRDTPGTDEDGLRGYRRAILSLIIAFVLLQPTVHLLSNPVSASDWFQVTAAVVLAGLILWKVWASDPGAQRTPWLILAIILVLAIALFVVGGKSGDWIPALAFAAAMCGRYSSTPVPAIIASVACAGTGLAMASVHHYNSGATFSAVAIGPLAGLFASGAGRRADTLEKLRRTRAELARAAVAEERLRIARDLHDLLGHSLSLITLKAQLAGRLIGSDPDRAATEIGELEAVARQSLSDVRGAVAGFRQPDLAGELAAARRLLDAAGIASDISSAGAEHLAQQVDAALAWAVREGATNVCPAFARDQGRNPGNRQGLGRGGRDQRQRAGRALAHRPRPAFTGSGLAGLAERVRNLGGELVAGVVEPQGFLLRVVLPLSPQA